MRKGDHHMMAEYHDNQPHNRAIKYKKMHQLHKSKEKYIERSKEIQFKKANKDYFPQAHSILQDESLQSSQTTKLRNSHTSRNFGFRLGSSRKSGSMSEKSTKKSTKSLQMEISILTHELYSKEKALLRKNCFERIKQSEMAQLYRIINFYEGKIQQLQLQLKRYEEALQKIGRQCDEKSKHKSQVEEIVQLYEQMRKSNEELHGKIQEKNYFIGELENKNHKLQIKLNFANSKANYLKENKSQIMRQKSIVKSLSFPSHLSSAITNFKFTKNQYGNIHSKINKIQASLQYLKKQNMGLQAQLDEKEQQIFELTKQLSNSIVANNTATCEYLKSSQKTIQDPCNLQLITIKSTVAQIEKNTVNQIQLSKNYKKIDPLNQVIILPKGIAFENESISQIRREQPQQPIIGANESELSEISEQKVIKRLVQSANQTIFKKLRYQLITQEIAYEELLQVLMGQSLQSQILQQSPYNLSSDEAEWVCEWITEAKEECHTHNYNLQSILGRIIPRFTNLTIRKENDLKIQISNEAFNRQKEFTQYVTTNSSIKNQEVQHYFRGWGLNQSHLDILCKSYYEQTGKIDTIDMPTIKSLIDRWTAK